MDFERLAEVLGRTLSEEVRQEAEQKKLEVAQELGLDPAEVSTGLVGLAQQIAEKGVVVDLHIGRARFEQGLSPEDVGLALGTSTEFLPDGFKEYLRTLYLGKRSLVTSEYQRLLKDLNNIEGRARNALIRKSFPIRLGFGKDVLRFVPLDVYRELRDELDGYAAEYEAATDELVAQLSLIRARTWDMLTEAAEEIYRMLQRNSALEISLQEFRVKFVTNAMDAFPDANDVRNAAVFQVRTMLVPFTAPSVSFSDDLQVLQDIKETLVAEKNAFVESVIGHLHQVVYDVVVSASACLKKHGTLLGPNVRALNDAFEAFNALNNVVGDRALAERLAVLQTLVQDSGARDLGSIAKALNELYEQTAEVLSTLGRAPRKTRGRGDDDIVLDVESFKGRALRGAKDEEENEISLPVMISVRRKRRGGIPLEGQMQLV